MLKLQSHNDNVPVDYTGVIVTPEWILTYRNGKLHSNGGTPAVSNHSRSYLAWYKDGKLHRDRIGNFPALISVKEYRHVTNGITCNETGPSIVKPNYIMEWHNKLGRKHNIHGPAVVRYPNHECYVQFGEKEYWVNGYACKTQEVWKQEVRKYQALEKRKLLQCSKKT